MLSLLESKTNTELENETEQSGRKHGHEAEQNEH